MRLTTLLPLTALLLAASEAVGQISMVTEVEAECPLVATTPRFTLAKGRDIDSHLTLTFGPMKKLSNGRALGITGSVMTTGGKSGSRAELRYGRRDSAGIEVHGSAGVAKWGIHGAQHTTENARGLTASVGVSRFGLGADARLDLLRTGDRNVSAFSVGARAGGKPGRFIMIAAAALAVLAVFSLFTGVGYSEAT